MAPSVAVFRRIPKGSAVGAVGDVDWVFHSKVRWVNKRSYRCRVMTKVPDDGAFVSALWVSEVVPLFASCVLLCCEWAKADVASVIESIGSDLKFHATSVSQANVYDWTFR